MADSRIKDLSPVIGLTTSHKLAVDKADMTDAGSITISDIATLLSSVSSNRGSESLTADVETTVTFATAFAALGYSLAISCYDVNGDGVGFRVTNRTVSSFKITAAANCTLNYIAMAI